MKKLVLVVLSALLLCSCSVPESKKTAFELCLNDVLEQTNWKDKEYYYSYVRVYNNLEHKRKFIEIYDITIAISTEVNKRISEIEFDAYSPNNQYIQGEYEIKSSRYYQQYTYPKW